VKGKIEFKPSYIESVHATAEIVECRVTLKSVQAPFRAVRGGELIVQGYLKEMQLTRTNRLLRVNETGKRISVKFESDGY
jgi:hypothetical protein